MARYSDIFRDKITQKPIAGALVTVTDYAGKLATLTTDAGGDLNNPFMTGEDGAVVFNAADGKYDITYSYGGRIVSEIKGEVVGSLIIAVSPSPANAGKFVALDGSGTPTYATGTGADAGLRTDLAAASGAALVKTVTGATVEQRINWATRPLIPFNGGDVNFVTSDTYGNTNDGASGGTWYYGRKLTGTITPGPAPTDRGYGAAVFHVDARYDDADVAGDFVRVGMFRTVVTGSAAKGGRIGLLGIVQLNSPTNAANTNRNYVGIVGQCVVYSSDGGTNTGAGAKGALFGGNMYVAMATGAVNYYDVSACEFDVENQTGTSARYQTGISVVGMNAVAGVIADSAIRIGAGSDGGGTYGPGVGFKIGLMWTDLHGNDPTNSSSILIGSNWVNTPGVRTITHGVDLSGFNCTGAIIQGQRTALSETTLSLGVNGSGLSVVAAGAGATAGTLVLQAKNGGDVALRPGTGRVSFGTFTSGTPTASGTIEIRDEGGTLRKLMVAA